MLKFGKFKLGNLTYDVHILETGKTTRIDIVSEGVEFNSVDELPIYAEYHKRGVMYKYGDSILGSNYNELQGLVTSQSKQAILDNKWQDGIFVTVETRENPTLEFNYTRVYHNSEFQSEIIHYGTTSLETVLVDSDFKIEISPLHLKEYTQSALSKDIDAFTDLPYRSLDILMRTYDLSWMQHKDYKIVESLEEAREYLKLLDTEKPEIIGYDYETTTLEFVNGNKDAQIVGLVLSHKRNFSRYFPFLHLKFDNLPISFMQEVVDCIKRNNIKTTAHNAKYENAVNYHYGFDLRMTYCTHVLSRLLHADQLSGHGLKDISFKLTGEHHLELTEIFLNKSKIDFRVLPKEIVLYYALSDADDGLFALQEMSKELSEPEQGLFEMESEITYLTMLKEYYGYRINRDHFIKEYDNALAIESYLADVFHGITQSNINIGSDKQLSELLYKRLNRPIYAYTGKGAPSVGVKAIQKLAKEKRENPTEIVKKDLVDKNGNLIISKKELNNAKYPECIILLRYKVYHKLTTAFYKRFYNSAKQDRYFTWISQMGTASGRESSPMHQLPSAVKYDILPDSEDHIFVDQDYSCMEIRAMSWLAGQTDLNETLKDKELDVHRGIAKIVTGIEPWALDKARRNLQKRTNFGIPYLIGPYSLAEQMFGAAPSKELVQQAADSQKAFLTTFKFVAQFLHNNRLHVLKNGFMSTYFGRIRRFSNIFDPGLPRAKREKMVREANNHPVQGSCADIMKFAQMNVGRWIERKGWNKLVDTPQGKFPLVRLALTIHDELLLSVHKSIPLVEVYEMLRECMQVEIEGAPPFYATPAVTANLGDCKADKFEIPIALRDEMIRQYHEEGKWHEPFKDPVQDQLALSNEHRLNSIVNWMEGLIQQYGTEDPEVIAEYAHHNVLTHDLVARFPQSKEHAKKYGSLSHIDAIKYAVEQYMIFRKSEDMPVVNTEKLVDGEVEEVTTNLSIDEVDALCNVALNYDDKGKLMNEEASDKDDYELEDSLTVFDEEYIYSTTNYKTPKVWTLFNMSIIDVNSLNSEQVDHILDLIDIQHKDGAYVQVKLYNKGSIIDTERRVPDFDAEPIHEYLKAIGKE